MVPVHDVKHHFNLPETTFSTFADADFVTRDSESTSWRIFDNLIFDSRPISDIGKTIPIASNL
jgi:hypothetical protein